MNFKFAVLLTVAATILGCQMTPQSTQTAFKTPQYSDLLGKWKLDGMKCSNGQTPDPSPKIAGQLEFLPKKVILSMTPPDPKKAERMEIIHFALQDNLFTYHQTNGIMTTELRLMNDGRLVVRSPLVGLQGDCTSSTALMEMTYSRL